MKDFQHFGQLLSGTVTSFFLKIVGTFFSYLFFLLASRTLGPQSIGVFSFGFAAMTIVGIVGRMGLDIYLLKHSAIYAASGRWDLLDLLYGKMLSAVFVSGAVLCVLSIFLIPAVLSGSDKSIYHAGIVLFSIAVIPFSMRDIGAEGLRGLKKIREYVFIREISVFLFATSILAILLLFDREPLAPVIAMVASQFITAIISALLWKKNLGRVDHACRSDETIRIRETVSASLPFCMPGIVFFAMTWADRMMLGAMASPKDLGFYEIAARVSNLSTFVLFAVNATAAPKLAELFSQNRMSEFQKVARLAASIAFLPSFAIILILFIYPDFFLSLFGKDFACGELSLRILLSGQFFNTLSGPVLVVLSMAGKEKNVQHILLSALILNIVLNYLLIPRFGIAGAAMATATVTTAWSLLSVFAVYNSFGFATFPVGWSKGLQNERP